MREKDRQLRRRRKRRQERLKERRRKMLAKLKIYVGPDHPHQAQQPKPLAD